MADTDTNASTTNKSKKIRLEVPKYIKDESVQARINKIDEYVEDYESLKGKISALVSAMTECKGYVTQTYGSVSSAISIKNADFTSKIGELNDLATKLQKTITNLESLNGQIDSEITKLSDERAEKEKHLYKWEMVEV